MRRKHTITIADIMVAGGFKIDGKYQVYKNDMYVFPVDYFCPMLTTGENVRTDETYCEHKGESSWAQKTMKSRIMSLLSPKIRTKLIKFKRKVLG